MNSGPKLGQHLDLVVGHELPSPALPADVPPETSLIGRKFIGVRFHCCATYSRVFMNRSGDAYQGNCPRCSRPVRIEIAPGGTDSRFFDLF